MRQAIQMIHGHKGAFVKDYFPRSLRIRTFALNCNDTQLEHLARMLVKMRLFSQLQAPVPTHIARRTITLKLQQESRILRRDRSLTLLRAFGLLGFRTFPK